MRGSLSSELPQLLGRVGCSAMALNLGSQFGVRNTNHLAPDSADGSPGLLTPVTPGLLNSSSLRLCGESLSATSNPDIA
jgi:hypothetical protein